MRISAFNTPIYAFPGAPKLVALSGYRDMRGWDSSGSYVPDGDPRDVSQLEIDASYDPNIGTNPDNPGTTSSDTPSTSTFDWGALFTAAVNAGADIIKAKAAADAAAAAAAARGATVKNTTVTTSTGQRIDAALTSNTGIMVGLGAVAVLALALALKRR